MSGNIMQRTRCTYFRGIAAGSAIAGTALDSSLGPTGRPLVGAAVAVLALPPLISLAVRGASATARSVAHLPQIFRYASR